MSKTINAKRTWFPFLMDNCLGTSTGSLSKMRRSMWGQNAYVVRCNKHLFHVNEKVFEKVASNS